jgi:Flp pilus assembly protein protease CpaA
MRRRLHISIWLALVTLVHVLSCIARHCSSEVTKLVFLVFMGLFALEIYGPGYVKFFSHVNWF